MRSKALLRSAALAIALAACACSHATPPETGARPAGTIAVNPVAQTDPVIQSAPVADLLIHNARVYTVVEGQPWAEAVALRGDRILWVGSEARADHYRGPGTRTLDAGGRLLLPGFIDSHSHIRFGSEENTVDLSGASDLEEIRATIRAFSDAHPDFGWITGDGWRYGAVREGLPEGLPHADQLAGTTAGRPAVFISYDGHTAWLNRAAMESVGLTGESDFATREEVIVDPVTGEPTGVVGSVVSLGSANPVLNRVWEKVDSEDGDWEEDLYRSLQTNLQQASRFGITTIVEPQLSLDGLALFERARREGILKARVEIALFHPPGISAQDRSDFADARRRLNDDQLRVRAVKLYIDDVIESHTAAMLEPYSNDPEQAGTTFYTPADFDHLVAELDREGDQLFIHAIGDRGIRIALDALEFAVDRNGARDSRHQLVHVEVVSPDDLPRFRQLGVVACMQPRHFMPEASDAWVSAIGEERMPHAMPWRSLHDAGAMLAFSSDWDVAEMDPLIGIYSAVTRQGLDGKPAGGFFPEQTLDVASALRAYTWNGAFANFAEATRGSIEVGKYADLILLSRNILEIPPDQILDTRVLLTLQGGEVVWADPDDAPPIVEPPAMRGIKASATSP